MYILFRNFGERKGMGDCNDIILLEGGKEKLSNFYSDWGTLTTSQVEVALIKLKSFLPVN
jgi:hypothetical protein